MLAAVKAWPVEGRARGKRSAMATLTATKTGQLEKLPTASERIKRQPP